jgi:ubiquinol-cytochrome c reductase cytochrome b subunit
LWLVLSCGISDVPRPGVLVDPRTYDAEYHESVTKSGVPFLGDALLKDLFASAVAVIVVVVIAAILGPKGPTGPPDPTLPGANPRPEWPFLWLFALLALSPPSIETFVMLVFPVVLIVALFLVPFVSNRGERAPSRRPVAVLSVIVIYTVLGILTYEGQTAPWSPDMTAWSGDAIPVRLVEHSSPLELQGAVVFQNKNCRNCHAIDGIGGRRGPDLTTVGVRLTSDQLIDQVSNGTPGAKGAPGGGEMPAYGKQIDAPQMTALAAFLASLRPAGQPPAIPAAQPHADPQP